MGYTGFLKLGMHPYRVDGRRVIGYTKPSKINFTHDEADNPTLVLHHQGVKQLFFVLGGSEEFRLDVTGPFFARDRSVNFQDGLLVCGEAQRDVAPKLRRSLQLVLEGKGKEFQELLCEAP